MKQKVISKKNVSGLLAKMCSGYRVSAPAHHNGNVELMPFTPGDEVLTDYLNVRLSPKSILFPQREVLCTYRDDVFVEAPLSNEKNIIFGVRPCDARAIWLLDKVFGEFGSTKDPYYLRRRENATIISLACLKADETCFCTSVGGGPSSREGSDLILFDIGDNLVAESITAKGEDIFEQYADFFANASKQDLAVVKAIEKAAIKSVPIVETDGLREKLEAGFESKEWESIASTCIGCGLCTYQCPTCYCFDITDESDGEVGCRIRTWDSCQFALFTQHASGHNPRPKKTQRMRQRIMHKFAYAPSNMNEVFCVGCGRCVRYCPVNLDIREVISRVRKS